MAKFVGNIVISVFCIGVVFIAVKSMPDLARYLKMREM